jgi:ATP-dependent DNA helicase RecG
MRLDTETETVEFKSTLAELKQGLISLVAMLNKHGEASLWFGVASNALVKGLTINEKTLRDVSQSIAAHIEPRIYPEITEKKLSNKTCLLVQAQGHQKPYFAFGRAYFRVADEDRQMSARELESLILRRNREALRWDNEPSNLAIHALNEKKIRQYLNRAGLPWDTAINALKKLDLLHEENLVNSVRLFFTDRPTQLRCAVFATESSATVIDQHDFEGDILELIEEADKYILKNTRMGMRLDGLVRIDVPEISREALREAIINAFCHRDWRDPDYVQVAIYTDRVEIRNPGVLFDDLTLADLHRGNISRRRNPLIAELFRRIRLVESWGRGMPLILENAPYVTFFEIAGFFVAKFLRTSSSLTNPLKTDKYPLKTNKNLLETDKTAKKISKISFEHVNPALNLTLKTAKAVKTEIDIDKNYQNRQKKIRELIFQFLSKQPQLSTSALAKSIGVSVESVRHQITQLKKAGKLLHIGSKKGGHWLVIDPHE